MEIDRGKLGIHTLGEGVLGDSAEEGPGLQEKLKATKQALRVAQDNAEFQSQKFRDAIEENGTWLLMVGDLEPEQDDLRAQLKQFQGRKYLST